MKLCNNILNSLFTVHRRERKIVIRVGGWLVAMTILYLERFFFGFASKCCWFFLKIKNEKKKAKLDLYMHQSIKLFDI